MLINFQSPKRLWLAVLFAAGFSSFAHLYAGTLTGSYALIPKGTVINLTAAGPLDWVHWGLYTETSIDRKAGVVPWISDFTAIANTNETNAAVSVFQFSDNYNGYSWSDGAPTADVTNTTTGVWAYGFPTPAKTGFEFEVPADTTIRTLKVYVGAFSAKGLFEAILSDGSASPYTNESLSNQRNGESAVYTIQYAANSQNQKLKIRWTLLMSLMGISGNVTLQAAALSATGANNPPSASITSPGENATYNTAANITITADAMDLDGSVTKVEFYDGNNRLGQTTASPYSFTWSNAPTGYHVLTAVATDNNADFGASMPVEIFVNGPGGSISGSIAVPTTNVNLTTEGKSDWAHWGLSTNSTFNHKAGVTRKISDVTALGDNPPERYDNNFTAYSWSDGAPTVNASNTTTGIFVLGYTNGFQISVPADKTTKRVKVYAGAYGARGNFQAYLSDFSAKAYTDTSISNLYSDSYAVFTIDYAAASAGQNLIIQYRAMTLYDSDFGNVTLQAATFVETNSAAELQLKYQITTAPNGAAEMIIGPAVPQPYSLDASGTLTNWVSIFTNQSGASSSNYTQTPLTNSAQRFFRGKRWP